MEQGIAILVSPIIGTLVIAVFVAVGRSAHTVGSTNDIAAAAARWRRIVFWGLSVLFVPRSPHSLTKTPYGHDLRSPGAVVRGDGAPAGVGAHTVHGAPLAISCPVSAPWAEGS